MRCREEFDLDRVEVEEWHCQFLLDDALHHTSQSAAASLQAACTILPGIALPMSFVHCNVVTLH